jgi:hypothetical protein
MEKKEAWEEDETLEGIPKKEVKRMAKELSYAF